MNAFKYLTITGCLRLLDTLSLRLTPPAEFNDPFELHPPVENFFDTEQITAEAKKEIPERAIDDVAQILEKHYNHRLTVAECRELIQLARININRKQLIHKLQKFNKKVPELNINNFSAIRSKVEGAFKKINDAITLISPTLILKANEEAKKALQIELPQRLGVVCLSKNGMEPLMWAHYADSHKGVMVEFITSHTTFNRRQHPNSHLGIFRDVKYVHDRLNVDLSTTGKGELFERFTLTKSHHWEYENEVRLILQLKDADQKISHDGLDIFLINTPILSIASITFGCKTAPQDMERVIKILEEMPNTKHILLRKATLHETKFDLIYQEIKSQGALQSEKM